MITLHYEAHHQLASRHRLGALNDMDKQGGQMLTRLMRPASTTLPVAIGILALLAAGCASAPEEEIIIDQPTEQIEPVVTPAPAPEPIVALQPRAPETYVVQPGDTLWDISSKFLRDPWYWPEIWIVNEQVRNPHLIYPGDVLTLYFGTDGQPYLQRTARLSPSIRTEGLTGERQLPIQAIRQFIIRPRVVTEEQLEAAPYIIGSQDRRLIYGSGDQVYVRKLPEQAAERYSVFRAGDPLVDPRSGEVLGFEAIQVADADVQRLGDPATVRLREAEREALTGDRLLPLDQDEDRAFIPRPPDSEVDGTVVSLFDAISQVGQYQVAVINLGERDGIDKGHVLAVFEAGRTVNDPFASGDLSKRVTLPDERTGVMMVFRPFEKVSYALIMEATRPIHRGDVVRTP
ncbi:MAG: LysM peptidoglycan-binding domain-containing protein [Gammaproteobacteria bacterium]